MSNFHSLASSIVRPVPVECPSCGKIVIDDWKNLSNMVILHDILCPHCGALVIAASSVEL